MRSFIPWVGGKSQLAPKIVSLIPPHTTYVEPFMGAAWVFFAKARSKVEVLNDLNGDLVNLFRVARDRFEDLYRRRIFLITAERDYHDFVKRLQDGEWKDEIERALMFWYALKQSFGARPGGGWAFSRIRPPRSLDMDDLEATHHRLKGVYINDQNALACLERWDSEETFFYLDPPYMMTTTAQGRDCYKHTMSQKDHRRLSKALGQLKGKWLLSYDDDPFVREIYGGQFILETEVRYTSNNRGKNGGRIAGELLISNYDQSLSLWF